MIRILFLFTLLISFLFSDECSIKIKAPDKDRDGVEDTLDKYPNTPCDISIDNTYPTKLIYKDMVEYSSYDRVVEPVIEEDLSEIYEDYINLIINFVTIFNINNGDIIKIIGYININETKEYNTTLLHKRVETIKNIFVNLGIYIDNFIIEDRDIENKRGVKVQLIYYKL